MEFGKVANVDAVRFELPPDDPRTAVRLRGGKRSRLKVYVGAPVWSVPEWVGKIYPKKTPAREFLHHYSRQFNSIELNSTFYRVPDAATIKAWKAAVPEGFKFAPKLHQQFSHPSEASAALGARNKALGTFMETFEGLGDALGCFFLQLPPQLSIQALPALRAFLHARLKGAGFAVEFRHPSWFDRGALNDAAYELLHEEQASTVITDVAGRRDVLHTSLTTRTAMIRFVGNELHPSDFERLDDWIERLGVWIDSGLEELYFFLHHPTYANVPELAEYFIEKMNQRYSLSLQAPAGPPQLGLFA